MEDQGQAWKQWGKGCPTRGTSKGQGPGSVPDRKPEVGSGRWPWLQAEAGPVGGASKALLTTHGSHRGLAAEVDELRVTRWLWLLGPWAWVLGVDREAVAEERLKAIVAGSWGSGWRREDLSEVKTARTCPCFGHGRD